MAHLMLFDAALPPEAVAGLYSAYQANASSGKAAALGGGSALFVGGLHIHIARNIPLHLL